MRLVADAPGGDTIGNVGDLVQCHPAGSLLAEVSVRHAEVVRARYAFLM